MPLPNRERNGVFFSFLVSPDICVFVFFWMFGSYGILHFGHTKHVCKMQNVSVSLKNGVDILIFFVVNVQKFRLRIVITWFQCRFGLGVKYDLIVVLRSQFFECLRETLYKHALEHLEAAR